MSKKTLQYSEKTNSALVVLTVIAGVMLFMTGVYGVDTAFTYKNYSLYSRSMSTIFAGFMLTVIGCLFFSIVTINKKNIRFPKIFRK